MGVPYFSFNSFDPTLSGRRASARMSSPSENPSEEPWHEVGGFNGTSVPPGINLRIILLPDTLAVLTALAAASFCKVRNNQNFMNCTALTGSNRDASTAQQLQLPIMQGVQQQANQTEQSRIGFDAWMHCLY